MTVSILTGDCRDVLATMPDCSVQCCVTSPPYFGLRDYGHGGQIGLEQTPDAYVAEMVAVFREVRRVLRDDGTCWLNIGDSYSSTSTTPDGWTTGTKPKDLIGIPWMVAFALRADGWYLRQDIIWAKPNPMPESVTDRCTKAHEYLFLLTKQARYYYDAKAIAEPALQPVGNPREASGVGFDHKQQALGQQRGGYLGANAGSETRNRRSVWPIATQPFSGAHFATMPPDLVEPCIKAGTSERGQCPHCGAPWVRETSRGAEQPDVAASSLDRYGDGSAGVHRKVGGQYQKWLDANPMKTIGWSPSCTCPAHDPIPQTVLDPFGGAGTTALVADRLQRNATIIELNPAYAQIARDRINGDGGLFAEVAAE